jgi:hypothetical protein
MAPDIEKRTVSSAHVPDLDGDRLVIQEHRQYLGAAEANREGHRCLGATRQ